MYDAAGSFIVINKAPAQNGKANVYLIEFLAKNPGIAKPNITLVADFTNPHKRLEIDIELEDSERFLAGIAMKDRFSFSGKISIIWDTEVLGYSEMSCMTNFM